MIYLKNKHSQVMAGCKTIELEERSSYIEGYIPLYQKRGNVTIFLKIIL